MLIKLCVLICYLLISITKDIDYRTDINKIVIRIIIGAKNNTQFNTFVFNMFVVSLKCFLIILWQLVKLS